MNVIFPSVRNSVFFDSDCSRYFYVFLSKLDINSQFSELVNK